MVSDKVRKTIPKMNGIYDNHKKTLIKTISNETCDILAPRYIMWITQDVHRRVVLNDACVTGKHTPYMVMEGFRGAGVDLVKMCNGNTNINLDKDVI